MAKTPAAENRQLSNTKLKTAFFVKKTLFESLLNTKMDPKGHNYDSNRPITALKWTKNDLNLTKKALI